MEAESSDRPTPSDPSDKREKRIESVPRRTGVAYFNPMNFAALL